MTYQHISYAVEAPLLIITLNRPEKLNAFTERMLSELLDALDRADADDSIRAIIFTGAGRAFCAGADLSLGGATFDRGEIAKHETLETHRDGGGQFVLRAFESKKPLIAAINGPAVGVGATMTLPMDIRIASDTARIGFVFAKRGIVPEACSSWFLPRIVGINQAAEWVYTGRIFPAQEALAARLISRLVATDQLLDTARAIGREIAEGTSAMSVALARHLMWKMMGAGHPRDAHLIDSKCIYWMGRSPDAHEGVRSFLEKRAPEFTMKPSSDMPDFFPW